MNQTYLKYGFIAAAVIVVFYVLMRRRRSPPAASGAIDVAVEYTPTSDPGALAARSQAFGDVAGLFGLALSEQSELEQSRMSQETARHIVDVERQVEEMRILNVRDLAEFQASQVNFAAESFRNKDPNRMAAYLNALTSIWGTPPTYLPQPPPSNKAADIINAVGNTVGKFFSFGLG